MFGFLKRWGLKRALRKALKRVKMEPSPANTAELISCYVDLGMLDEAEDVGKQAKELYPLSVKVNDSVRKLHLLKYDGEIRRLRSRLKEQASPTSYAMLAELYNEIGETEKALEICREAVDKFPNYEGIYLVVGKIRYNRFLQEGLPRDGVEAVENFEKAVKLNNANYKTMVRLGRLYLDLGLADRAAARLNSALIHAPGDEEATELLRRASEMPPPEEEDLEECFKRLCEARRAEEDSEIILRFGLDELNEMIAHLEPAPGVHMVVAITKDGRRLASKAFDGTLQEEAALTCARQIYSAANDSCERMDIGRFVRGIFAGKKLQVHMIRFDDMIVALFADGRAHRRIIEQYLDRFIDDELYALRGGGR